MNSRQHSERHIVKQIVGARDKTFHIIQEAIATFSIPESRHQCYAAQTEGNDSTMQYDISATLGVSRHIVVSA